MCIHICVYIILCKCMIECDSVCVRVFVSACAYVNSPCTSMYNTIPQSHQGNYAINEEI